MTNFRFTADSLPQVNAGPLAYAQAFLDKSVMTSHPHKHIEKLQQVYRSVSLLHDVMLVLPSMDLVQIIRSTD